ncbi:helix-turn-helix transcriptional regulator [Aromatoleum buckelii]|uniref:AlpA family phage regulatory protein n=1 Tax=Aromatoleum buckelii TaxID=200254 RepID=A0ABX1N7L8_9RHOO|nr:AlpA family phage regulatory protein [Aromatoleum buckelii]MCK0511944.1 AlpA family phage regulatory protein [Aromatoleum buckelii]
MPDDELVRMPEASRITARSPRAIRSGVARGEFPAPLKIGARAIAWPRSELQAWIASRPRAEIHG